LKCSGTSICPWFLAGKRKQHGCNQIMRTARSRVCHCLCARPETPRNETAKAARNETVRNETAKAFLLSQFSIENESETPARDNFRFFSE
jgi:hypothetical protein